MSLTIIDYWGVSIVKIPVIIFIQVVFYCIFEFKKWDWPSRFFVSSLALSFLKNFIHIK